MQLNCHILALNVSLPLLTPLLNYSHFLAIELSQQEQQRRVGVKVVVQKANYIFIFSCYFIFLSVY